MPTSHPRHLVTPAASFSRRVAIAACILTSGLTLAHGSRASAAFVTWSGATSSAWSVGSNWVGGNVPTSADTLFFNATASSFTPFNDSGAARTVASMNVSGTVPYDIDANGATITNGFINSNSGAATPNTVRNLVISATSGQATNSAGYQVVFRGVSGTSSTFKAGNGTLIWAGSNTYSGSVSLNVGTYINNSSIGSTITQASAVTTLGGSGTFGSIISTSGTVQPGSSVTSVGVLSTSGAITLGGTTSVVLQVSGTGQGIGYDALIAGGALDYGNAIVKLDSLPGTAFANGSTFQLFGAGSFQNGISSLVALTQYAGQSLTFSGPGGGGEWSTGVLGNGQTLTFTPSSGQLVVVPEPAACVAALAGLAVGALGMVRRRRS